MVDPGIVIAVTGVGAENIISSLVAGTNFGTVLIWAIVFGAFLKFVLTEVIGRWYMASGETILKGWHMLGRSTTWYFLIYLFVVTYVFGAAVTSTAALGVLPVSVWAVLHGLLGFVDRGYRLLRTLRADNEGSCGDKVRGDHTDRHPGHGLRWERSHLASSPGYRRADLSTRWLLSEGSAARSRSLRTRTGCASVAGGVSIEMVL